MVRMRIVSASIRLFPSLTVKLTSLSNSAGSLQRPGPAWPLSYQRRLRIGNILDVRACRPHSEMNMNHSSTLLQEPVTDDQVTAIVARPLSSVRDVRKNECQEIRDTVVIHTSTRWVAPLRVARSFLFFSPFF